MITLIHVTLRPSSFGKMNIKNKSTRDRYKMVFRALNYLNNFKIFDMKLTITILY